jgi:hypothetical protein
LPPEHLLTLAVTYRLTIVLTPLTLDPRWVMDRLDGVGIAVSAEERRALTLS